tara:strand:- start:205 stop:597 length:393 start_codon:yes stop_codon:yes gene_type:complete
MIKLRGYIFSRTFMGERVPQNVQNLVLRDYCLKNKHSFLLSLSEYAMTDCFAMLNDAINESENDGIVAYSIFQMPFENIHRIRVLEEVIKRKKTIHFALENIAITNKKDLEKINEIWMIKKNLENCLSRI